MSYPINYPTPQGANVQIFRGGDDSGTAHVATREWVKPQGASFVWFTLIGAGGGGGGSMIDSSVGLYYGGGGASGNVTNFMCPAFLLPDVLEVAVGRGGNGGADGGVDTPGVEGISGNPTKIIYQQKDGYGYTLLQASGGGGGAGAAFTNGGGGNTTGADVGGPMTVAGFFNSTAGQIGKNGSPTSGGKITTNGLTFVMGGSGRYYNNPTQVITGYYGYTASEVNGYSQLSPIPLSMGGSDVDGTSTRQRASSFGCGGNGGGNVSTSDNTYGSRGGDGLAIIVTW